VVVVVVVVVVCVVVMATKDHFHGWQGRRWCDVEERAA